MVMFRGPVVFRLFYQHQAAAAGLQMYTDTFDVPDDAGENLRNSDTCTSRKIAKTEVQDKFISMDICVVHHMFGDYEDSTFSIHNLLQAVQDNSFPMDICVVSVDEDGERGGAPVLCIKDAMRQCSEFSRGQLE
ncbi:hypothetical protein Tco_1308816 [Tanacetum coccineum]